MLRVPCPMDLHGRHSPVCLGYGLCSTTGFSPCLATLFICSLFICHFEEWDSGSDIRFSGSAAIQIINCSYVCLILCVDGSFHFTDVFLNTLLWPKSALGFVYVTY